MVNLKLLCIRSEVVIPAKAGIQLRNTGFQVKPGMTNKGKRFLTQHTRIVEMEREVYLHITDRYCQKFPNLALPTLKKLLTFFWWGLYFTEI